MEKTLLKYQNLIRKEAYQASKKWKVEYEECLSEAYLIFCESLKKYDIEKSNLSTFLTINIKGYLNNYCKRLFKKRMNLVEIKGDEENLLFTEGEDILFKKFCSTLKFYDQIETELNKDCIDLYIFLIESYGIKKLTKRFVLNYYRKYNGWKLCRIKNAWNNLKEFWLNNHKEYSYV